MNSDKQSHELQVFEQFLAISQLRAVPGTLRCGDPNQSEPDIICTIERLGTVGFEMTRIAEEDFMETTAQVRAIDNSLREQFVARPELKAKYSDADIGVVFDFRQGMRTVRRAIPHVLHILAGLPAGFNETHSSREAQEAGVQWLTVTRIAGHAGPSVYAQPPAMWVGDPTLASIDAKLAKSYSANPPRRELIAYYSEQPPALDDIRRPAMEKYLNSLLDLGPFERIWVLNLWSPAIDAVRSASLG